MAYDFPNTPSIGQVYNGYVWDGEKWLSSGSPGPVLPYKKNYIINGSMQVSQENGSVAGNSSASAFYPVDQFFIQASGTTGVASVAQVASATPAGSPNRIRATVTTADASVAAGDIIWLQQYLEGLRAADLRLGSAAAKTITIQFGVKAPAGTYCVSLINGAVNRCYVAEYVISAGEANTDVVKSVTVALDQTGTWATDSTIGLGVRWGLMAGSTFQTVANAWGTTNAIGSSSQFNFMGTVGNVFELFDVSMVTGAVAPPHVVEDFPSVQALCLRYYNKSLFTWRVSAVASGIYCTELYFKVPMRTAATCALTGASRTNVASASFVNADQFQTTFQAVATAAGDTYVYGETLTINARL